MLKKLLHLFLTVLVAAVMLLMQKYYLDHHKDPVPAGNETGGGLDLSPEVSDG